MSEARDRLCLKAIAPRLLELMREIQSTTSESIATMLISRFAVENPNLSGQDTIRRRIYDVINVLSAAGVIEKTGKKLTWVGLKQSPAQNRRTAQQQPPGPELYEKEKKLYEKIRLLTRYKLLINRNFPNTKPENGISFPMILFCTKKLDKPIIQRDETKNETTISVSRIITILSPTDVILSLPYDKEILQQIASTDPRFGKYVPFLIQEDAQAEEQEQ